MNFMPREEKYLPLIYFFRHGKDDVAFRGGWSQRGMIEEGFCQARVLANYLAHHRICIRVARDKQWCPCRNA